MQLHPKDFVSYLLDELGTNTAADLVEHAFDVVYGTGKPARWILETWRARERGDISPEVAHFLITQSAVSTVLTW